MIQIRLYDPDTGRTYAGLVTEDMIEFDKFNEGFMKKYKTMLGKILLHINALKRRGHLSNNARWEVLSGYSAICGWTTGSWNPVLFGKEILRGDWCRVTADRWIFRAQTQGTYIISSRVTVSSSVIQDARLGIFKNGSWYCDLAIMQFRIYDTQPNPTPIWHYHATENLNGTDQVYLEVGDEIEIRYYFVSDVTGGSIGKISGHVNVALAGNNTKQISATVDTWS